MAGYLLAVSLLYGLQERIIFQPDVLARGYSFQFGQDFKELYLPHEGADTALHAILFPAWDSVVLGLVLYFHGNADNLQRWGQYAVDFTRRGYEVLAIDYPGYGKSGGRAGEQAMYRSAAQAFQWARERFATDRIIIYGRSLGCGPAAWLAARQEVQQLILETPFPSIPQLFRMRAGKVFVPIAPRIKFPVVEYLESVDYPVSIFQGTNDRVVPYQIAARLKTALKPEDRFYTIVGGGHKNLRHFPVYQETLATLLR